MEFTTNSGWVKIHRSILKWGWWTDHNTTRLFIGLLVKANHEQTEYLGHHIPAGSLVFGYSAWSKKMGLSVRQLRTALAHLKTTGEVTVIGTRFFSIVSITNWERYQTNDRASDNEATTKRQRSDNEATASKELKNKRIKEYNSDFDLEAIYALYPKKEGKKKGLESLAKQIKTDEQYENLKLAVQNYANKVLEECTDVKYQKHFSTFANCWADYTTIEKSMSAQDLAKKAELELEAKFNKMDEEAIAKLGGAND